MAYRHSFKKFQILKGLTYKYNFFCVCKFYFHGMICTLETKKFLTLTNMTTHFPRILLTGTLL